MSECTVYIDEAGDLGYRRGTRWFILTAVVVDKESEKSIRNIISQLKTKLNVKEIHFRKLADYYKKALVVKELNEAPFQYVNVIVDTEKLNLAMASSSSTAYNYICRLLLERVSWLLRDSDRTGDIVLSARGTARDNELISYIKDKLLTYDKNQIDKSVFKKISAKTAASWDMLQLADVCATTMFYSYECNGWGFCTPCYSKVLKHHLYNYNGKVQSYGIKYFSNEMKISLEDQVNNYPCKEKERTSGTTTTCQPCW